MVGLSHAEGVLRSDQPASPLFETCVHVSDFNPHYFSPSSTPSLDTLAFIIAHTGVADTQIARACGFAQGGLNPALGVATA